MSPEERWAFAEEIVEAQDPQTVEEARRFAAAWIDSATMFAQDAEYWRERAHVAEQHKAMTDDFEPEPIEDEQDDPEVAQPSPDDEADEGMVEPDEDDPTDHIEGEP